MIDTPILGFNNRIAKAAMSERIAIDGALTQELINLYARWARGGAGLLITGNVMVDRRHIGESGNVVVEDASQLDALRRWAQTIKSGGAKAWMQINHPGRQTPRFLTPQPVAPSAVAMKGTAGTFARPRALRDAEIREIIARFARTAQIAEQAGFDGVQIHGAHGYLVSQFLSPQTNLRDDAWGGDAQRRRRFLSEVIEAVRGAVSPGFAVGLKLNSADFQRGGFSNEACMDVIRSLEGIELLEISGGTYESASAGMFAEASQAESTRQREAFFLDFAEQVRDITDIPLMVTGGFRTKRGMNDALRSGATDVIGIARPLAVDPELPRRLLDGEVEQATPIRLKMGIKQLDAIVQGSWYQLQLERIARGAPVDPKLSRARAIAFYMLPRKNLTPLRAS